MIIMKDGSDGYWDATRGVKLASLEKLLSEDDQYGMIVEIKERDGNRLKTIETHWVGPLVARVDFERLVDMGYADVDKGIRFSVGPFPVRVLDLPDVWPIRGVVVMRETNLLANIVVYLVYWMTHYARDIDERLRWTARIWGLIPGRATVPVWGDLRPYRWLRDKWDLFLAPGSPPQELPKLPDDRGEWGKPL